MIYVTMLCKHMTYMNKKSCYYLFAVTEMFILVFLDQISKYAAVVHLKNREGISVIPDIFELYYLENLGAAWGILENARYFFLITAVILVGLIFWYYRKLPEERHWNLCRFFVVMLAAGAVGNAIDRFVHGYVIDFLYFSVINFPVFNVADCYVTVSIVLLLFFYRKEVYEWIRN